MGKTKTSTKSASSKRSAPATAPVKGKGSNAMSALDAAAKILQEHAQPMNCQQMIKTMLEKNYWSTQGKTPAATLYSAIIREIATKAKDSRFKKVERGMFAFSK